MIAAAEAGPDRGADGVPARLVLGRGGMRGIAMIGAVAALERGGYRFDRIAGVSAGAVVAALLAAGYDTEALRRLADEFEWRRLRDARGIGRIPVLGPAWRLLTRLGIHDGDTLLELLRDRLGRRGIRTFGDLRDANADRGSPYRLRVLTADLTRGRFVVLPDDAAAYGILPDRLEVATAVRMSASVPLLFRPLRLGTGAAASLVVDGGLAGGSPCRFFRRADDEGPTFVVRTRSSPRAVGRTPITGPVTLLRAACHTALAASAGEERDPAGSTRVVEIECGAVRSVDFALTELQKRRLYNIGFAAGLAAVGAYRPCPAPAPGPTCRRLPPQQTDTTSRGDIEHARRGHPSRDRAEPLGRPGPELDRARRQPATGPGDPVLHPDADRVGVLRAPGGRHIRRDRPADR